MHKCNIGTTRKNKSLDRSIERAKDSIAPRNLVDLGDREANRRSRSVRIAKVIHNR